MNIDYSQAKEQLEKMFEKDTGYRHIIFWFDPPRNFFDSVQNDAFPDAKTFIFENNPFTLKTLLETKDTKSNYLIYFPCEKPKDSENWLEDMLLYGEVYYADTIALTMNRLGIKAPELRESVSKHIHFFDSQDRIVSLTKKIKLSDSTAPADFEMAMLSVIVKSPKEKSFDYILREIIFDGADGDKYESVCKYGLSELFWNLAGELYNYVGVQDVQKLAESFLVTSVFKRTAFKVETPVLKSLVMSDNTENAEIFVDTLLKTDDRYPELEHRIFSSLKIKELIAPKGIDSLKDCDTFEEFDGFITSSIISSLAGGSYDYDFYLRVIDDSRISSYWYKRYESRYDFIRAVIAFRKAMAVEIQSGLQAEQYLTVYSDTLWKIDNAYRHLINCHSRLEGKTEEENSIVSEADDSYETQFLSKLGGEFSKSLLAKEPSFSFGGFKSAKNFFHDRINHTAKKQFVIISDALRYEVGMDLVKRLNSKEAFKGFARIDCQYTTLPSVTKFGMAALLPNREISYENKSVYVDGKTSDGTVARDAILKSSSDGYAAIQYDDIMDMKKEDLRAYMKDKSLVYIYHNTIDHAGENGLDTFEACNDAIDQIIELIQRLYNMLQISNYIVTSDHGFIYRNKKIPNSAKYKSYSFVSLDDFDPRYIVVNDDVTFNFTNRFSMDYLGGCKGNVIVPFGYDFFKTPSGAKAYIHGGASIQELLTPVITLSEMRSGAPGNVVEPVQVRLKSVIRKIMNKSFALQFEQMEKVEGKKKAAELELYFVDESNNVISNVANVVFNKTTDNLDERTFDVRFLLKNQDYDRTRRYFLIMKDSETGEIVSDDQQFVIDIVKFKMF
jgi:uncharacterized protein (TIGR02687 family)